MSTWGKYKAGGLSFTSLVFTQLGLSRTSFISPVTLTETGGATTSVLDSGRAAARFAGNSTNRLVSSTNVSIAPGGNSWFVFCRFIWNGFYAANTTCRIFAIGSSTLQVTGAAYTASFVPDSGSPINRIGGTLVSGENTVLVYGNVLAGTMDTYINGSLLGTNALTGGFATARTITIGDSSANSRGDFNVIELAIGDGSPTLNIINSTMVTAASSATCFLDVAPLGHAVAGTSTSELTFDCAILGGNPGALYTMALEKAYPKPSSGYTTVGAGATRLGDGAFTISDPNAGELSYYRCAVTSVTPVSEVFRTSNYTSKSQVHEVGNPYPGAAPSPQGVPAVGAFPYTAGMPRAIHGLGDSRFPVNDFKTIMGSLCGISSSSIYAVSRSGSNWRHWQNGNTTYPGSIDVYGDFKINMALVGAQPGDWVVVLLDVNALEAADAIGVGGYTDAVRTVVAQIVADGWVPKVVLDPLSASFGASTFDNYETHRAVIAAAITAAGGGAEYMTAGNVRREFNSRMPALSTDRTHWNGAGAGTILARMIGADVQSLVALTGGTISLPLGQTGVSSLYVNSLTPATGGGSVAYTWQDFVGSWADIVGASLVGATVITGIRPGATKIRRKVTSGSSVAYSNELPIALSVGGGSLLGGDRRKIGFGL